MPLTSGAAPEDLQIELAAPPGWRYAPGDIVIGHVARSTPIISPDACIKLVLIGRLKTKFYRERNVFKGCQKFSALWHLWTPEPEILFLGPLHLPASRNATRHAWDFSVAIPPCPDPSVADGHVKQESFLSLNAESVKNYLLPGSYRSRFDGLDICYEAVVEYYLEAEMSYIYQGTRRTTFTTRPIIIHNPVPRTQSIRGHIRQYTIRTPLRTEESLSDRRGSKAILDTKVQKLLGLHNNAHGSYTVEVSSPRIIQLNDPVPFPFVVKIFPESDTPDAMIKSNPGGFRLDQLIFRIHTKVTVSANSSSGPEALDYYTVHDIRLAEELRSLSTPIIIPAQQKPQEVNIGSIFQLSLASTGLCVRGRMHRKSPLELHHDFVTYNIKLSNSLQWKLSITRNKKTHVLQDCNSLRILAPSSM